MSQQGQIRPILVVFDVDGTLVDSRATILRAAREAAERVGLASPSYEDVRQIVGLSLRDALGALAPGLGPKALDDFVGEFQSAFRRVQAEPGHREPLYDGAVPLLQDLKRRSWALAMATGNSRRGVERLLAQHEWADVFDSTHCADDGPGKPDPAMLDAAMQTLAFSPDRTVMVGDTAHDMRMAKAAGVRALGVTWGFHTATEIQDGGADLIVHDFPALAAELVRFAALS